MRITVVRLNKIHNFLFAAFVCLSLHVKGQSANQGVSVSFEDWPLSKVLNYLTEHHSLQFSYSREQVPLDLKISIRATEIPITEIMTRICDQAGLEYKLIDELYVLRKKTSLSSFVKSTNNFAEVAGVVLDSASGKPLPFANVFFDNSSFGITTDSIGKFTLNKVPIDMNRLVVSYIGYRTLLTIVSLKSNSKLQLIIRLQPTAKQLSDVVVVGKRDKSWLRDFEQFKSEILGRTANAEQCIIQNPNVIQLKRSSEILTANTKEPLVIENEALGYREQVLIEKFISNRDSCSFVFYSRFDTLKPSSERERFRWELNRLNVFTGSQIHLFKSILNHKSAQEGFEVFEWKGTAMRITLDGRYEPVPNYLPLNIDSLYFTNESHKGYSVLKPGKYLIRYKKNIVAGNSNYENIYPTSIIKVRNDSMFVNAMGIPLLSNNYSQFGYFETQRIADKLPNDYDEIKSKEVVVGYEKKRIGKIALVVVDSLTGKAIPNVLGFVNNSTIHIRSNENGRIIFRNVPQGNQELIFYKIGYQLTHLIFVSTNQEQIDTIRLTRTRFRDLEQTPIEIRELYLDQFQTRIFGEHFDGRRITNPEVINLTSSGEDTVRIWSLSPIEIVDKHLGYKINFFLDQGVMIHRETKIISFTFHGYSYFEDLNLNAKKIDIEAKRLEVYNGSFLNFSRCLLDGRVLEEGFKLFSIDEAEVVRSSNKKAGKELQKQELNAESVIVSRGSSGFTVSIPPSLEVQYTTPNSARKKFSRIVTNQHNIPITDFGITLPNEKWKVTGAMEEKGQIPKLPINFKPIKGVLLNSF